MKNTMLLASFMALAACSASLPNNTTVDVTSGCVSPCRVIYQTRAPGEIDHVLFAIDDKEGARCYFWGGFSESFSDPGALVIDGELACIALGDERPVPE